MTSRKWKPKEGERSWMIDGWHGYWEVQHKYFWAILPVHENALKTGNCFRTKKEAEAARGKIAGILKRKEK